MFDLISGLVERSGYVGIALLMFAENLFPPIPSEVIMPVAGFAAARGDLDIFLVVLAGAIGSALGAAVWFYVGLWFGSKRLRSLAARYGRWLTISPDEVDRATAWFRRHAGLSVFMGRMVPGVRTLISVPAGVARMPKGAFALYTTLGSAIWSGALAAAGYALGENYERVSDWLNPATTAVLVLIASVYIYRVITFQKAA